MTATVNAGRKRKSGERRSQHLPVAARRCAAPSLPGSAGASVCPCARARTNAPRSASRVDVACGLMQQFVCSDVVSHSPQFLYCADVASMFQGKSTYQHDDIPAASPALWRFSRFFFNERVLSGIRHIAHAPKILRAESLWKHGAVRRNDATGWGRSTGFTISQGVFCIRAHLCGILIRKMPCEIVNPVGLPHPLTRLRSHTHARQMGALFALPERALRSTGVCRVCSAQL